VFQLLTFNIGGARKLRGDQFSHSDLGVDVFRALSACLDTTQPTVIALQETGIAHIDGIQQSSFRMLTSKLGSEYRVAFAAELSTDWHAHQRLWTTLLSKHRVGARRERACHQFSQVGVGLANSPLCRRRRMGNCLLH
jgi:hypothetical protein